MDRNREGDDIEPSDCTECGARCNDYPYCPGNPEYANLSDDERQRRIYYDRKTAHRDEMLIPLMWMAVAVFVLWVVGSVWNVIRGWQ